MCQYFSFVTRFRILSVCKQHHRQSPLNLLSGILLDTNNFRNKVSSHTFSACSYLQTKGANNTLANSYLKDEFEEFELKNKIMNNMTSPLFSVMVATSDEQDIVDKTILAKVANEMLEIKGIETSFVIGRISKKDVYISARSSNDTNVQFILEKMGGGGHFSSAAVLLKDISIETAKSNLLSILELYYAEAKGD